MNQVEKGNSLAIALVDHLQDMGGACSCVIPVIDRSKEYVVIVMPKADYEAQQKVNDDT